MTESEQDFADASSGLQDSVVYFLEHMWRNSFDLDSWNPLCRHCDVLFGDFREAARVHDPSPRVEVPVTVIDRRTDAEFLYVA